jgi:hypothetical protein
MKSIIFWDMTPCNPSSINRRFGVPYRLHFQGRRNKFSMVPANKQVASFLNLFLQPWRWRRYVPPKRRFTLNGLQGVIFQKMILFISSYILSYGSRYFTGNLKLKTFSQTEYRTSASQPNFSRSGFNSYQQYNFFFCLPRPQLLFLRSHRRRRREASCSYITCNTAFYYSYFM